MVLLELDQEIELGLRRRAALTEHTVEEVAEAILSQVLLDEE
jgi:plasmid stability protein